MRYIPVTFYKFSASYRTNKKTIVLNSFSYIQFTISVVFICLKNYFQLSERAKRDDILITSFLSAIKLQKTDTPTWKSDFEVKNARYLL